LPLCQYVFGQVHILTLTFGTSLIGVSVDYSMHYFVNRMRDGAAKPHDIAPALMLGCTTAVGGYLSLLIAPIPGLRQIALFSAVGLVVACAIVILLYPGLERRPMPRPVPAWVTDSPRLESRPFCRAPRGGCSVHCSWVPRSWGSRGSRLAMTCVPCNDRRPHWSLPKVACARC
jgi:hypothetical protein